MSITALVIAFSQPYNKSKNIIEKSGQKSISIFVDNSMSMQNDAGNGNLVESSKKVAKSIIELLDDNDEIQILTNDFLPQNLRFYNKENALGLIDKVKLSSKSNSLRNIYKRQWSSLNEKNGFNKNIVIISDFQKSYFNVEQNDFDSTVTNLLVPIEANNFSNLYVDSVWFESPVIQYNQSSNLKVKLVNNSERNVDEVSVKLILNDENKAISTVSFAPNESKTIQIPFTVSNKGWNRGIISIDDFPVTFDDQYYFVFFVKETISVLGIYDDKSNQSIKKIFKPEPYINFTQVASSNIDFSKFKDYQLIVLDELDVFSSGLINELVKFTSAGGNLLIIPSGSDKIDFKDYEKLYSQLSLKPITNSFNNTRSVGYLNFEHPFFADIYDGTEKNILAPKINKYYVRDNKFLSNEITLIGIDKMDPILTFSAFNKGNIFTYYLSMENEWSELLKSHLFASVVLKMAFYQNLKNPLYYSLDQNNVELDINEDLDIVKIRENEKVFLPKQKIYNGMLNIVFDEQFDKAGFYEIIDNDDNIEGVLAVNFSKKESKIDVYSKELLADLSEQKGFQTIKATNGSQKNLISINESHDLWKLFLIIALAFLLTEILIIRLWK